MTAWLAAGCKGGTTFPVLSFHVGKDQMSEPTARIKVERFMGDIRGWKPTVGWRWNWAAAGGGGLVTVVVGEEIRSEMGD